MTLIDPPRGGGRRTTILAASVLLYWLACFFPYQWVAPYAYVQNDATRLANGGLAFGGSGFARVPLTVDLADAASLRMRLCARSHSPNQTGPARIVTQSVDSLLRNFTLAQIDSDLELRWRRAESNANGTPAWRVADVFVTSAVVEIEVIFDATGVAIMVDGVERLRRSAAEATPRDWEPAYPLLLGNEATHDRPWAGEILLLEIHADGRQVVDLVDTAMELPRGAWLPSERVRRWHRFRLDTLVQTESLWRGDIVFNVLGFVPFGMLLGWLWPPRHHRMNVWIAGLASLALSASIEFGQVGFAGRFPSATDLVTNTLGGMLGLLGWQWLTLRRRASDDSTGSD